VRKKPGGIQPRGLTVTQTAQYWGVSPNTFKKLVRAGHAPGPIKLPGIERQIFDLRQQEAAMDKYSGFQSVSEAPEEDDPTWA
jgi:hypothetical protein